MPLSSDESSTPRNRFSHSNLSTTEPLSSTNSTVEKCNRQSRGPPSSDDCPFRRTNHQRPAPGIFTPISQLPNPYPARTRRSINAIDSRWTVFVRRLPLSSDESSTPRTRHFHPKLSTTELLPNTNSTVKNPIDCRGKFLFLKFTQQFH